MSLHISVFQIALDISGFQVALHRTVLQGSAAYIRTLGIAIYKRLLQSADLRRIHQRLKAGRGLGREWPKAVVGLCSELLGTGHGLGSIIIGMGRKLGCEGFFNRAVARDLLLFSSCQPWWAWDQTVHWNFVLFGYFSSLCIHFHIHGRILLRLCCKESTQQISSQMSKIRAMQIHSLSWQKIKQTDPFLFRRLFSGLFHEYPENYSEIWSILISRGLGYLIIRDLDDRLADLFPTWKLGVSWPAQRSRRSIRRKVVRCLLYMLYCAPMMFTCIKVLNCLVVKGGLYMWNMNHWNKQQSTGWAKTNKLTQDKCRWGRLWEGLSLTQGQDQDGWFARHCKE